MKLTKREKILLFGTFIIVIAVAFYTYFYLPYTKKISTLKEKSENLELQIQITKSKVNQIEPLKAEVKQLQEENKTKYTNIPEIWDQAELLVHIENTIKDYCDRDSIDFFDTVDSTDVSSGDISLKFNAKYEDLKTILKKFENSSFINSLTAIEIIKIQDNSTQINEENNSEEGPAEEANNESTSLEVIMTLKFYSTKASEQYPEDYTFTSGKYGNTNIFE